MTVKQVKANPLKGRIKDIDIRLIDEPKVDVRAWISEEHITNLAESLRAVGLIHEPIVVEKNGRYEVVSGHCRQLAAVQLGWTTLRCKVVNSEEVEQEFFKLHENLYRQDLSAVEKAQALQHTKARFHLTDEVLAHKFGMSRTWATRVLHALTWPKDIQQANLDGVLGYEVCDTLRKITNDQVRQQYTSYAIADGCTKRLAHQWYNEWLRNERIKENLRAREENLTDHPLIASDEDLLADARAQQQATVRSQLGALRKPCGLCKHEHPLDQLISWDLCPLCVQYLYNNVKDQVNESIVVPG